MRRRVLVAQTRIPEIDRDTGAQRLDLFMRWLLERDWSVTFLATKEDIESRHAHRLNQLGIPTYVGLDEAEGVVASGEFDLALVAFWEPASRLLPILRAVSPKTRVVVDSIDVHFLREARRRILLDESQLDDEFGARLASELSTYNGADAVLTVSSYEARLLGDFLGPERIHEIPLAHTGRRATTPFEARRGILFIGNFRHTPNAEAVGYLCQDVLPRIAPDLLAKHPVYVVGNRLSQQVAAHKRGLRAPVKMVGWVPSVDPYLERSRVCVVPLLHGAGVKGKVVESLMAGTPVVTTTVGAEGLALRHGEHVLIADTPEDLADGLTHVLTDPARWESLADAGYEHAAARHAPERVAERFDEVLDRVLTAPARSRKPEDARHGKNGREAPYRELKDAIASTLHAMTPPGAHVLVVSHGDNSLLACEGRMTRHFPQGPGGEWAGFHPADGPAAIEELEKLRERGARYLVLPSTQFWWLHFYRELTAHLQSVYRQTYADDHLIVFDLAPEPRPACVERKPAGSRERVVVIGSFDPSRTAPPAALIEELERAKRYDVRQRWQPGDAEPYTPTEGEADWILYVDDTASLPTRFIDDFFGIVAALDADRAQPAHVCGPAAGPPVTERLLGVLAREIEAATPLPVTAVRAGASLEGPVALIDAVPIAVTRQVHSPRDPRFYSRVLDVFAAGPDEKPARVVRRSHEEGEPQISVLIATYDRSGLLAECLDGFSLQTLAPSNFELVVIDDGSGDPETQRVLANYATQLPLTWAQIEHSGRGAAKNLALMLARGKLVLWFDDDDRPAPDLLEEHIRAHAENPDEATAILGYTGWDPRLEVTPLMHYLTEVDRMLFAYPSFEPGQRINWQGFWEGRVSAKRSLHVRHGLHDQRLEYSIDVELAWRLRKEGLEVVYHPFARSVMQRAIDFEAFCRRYEAKGRAQAAIASLHDDPEMREYAKIEGAAARWKGARPRLAQLKGRISELERALQGRTSGGSPDGELAELHRCYRQAFFAHNAKGIVDVLHGDAPREREPEPAPRNGSSAPATHTNGHSAPTTQANGHGAADTTPQLSIVMPVWSRTQELADMAARTLERVWEVARIATEVIVIDNGSPFERELPARVHRFPENRGVASAWNAGIRMAQAPVIAVLNSDCIVEPGWDEALYEAATTGRRIAFPYTDHCDGEGFRQPDQGGTAGWCYMLTQELFDEIGPFDEWFNPAYGEDTDYWHRAWELGIELSPVPAARVTHSRRTSMREEDRADMLLLGHRYKYGWKHGVDPLKAPPYYNREIVEYHCTLTG
jgi:glycosyltransferase involved in cell wall biosynthesis